MTTGLGTGAVAVRDALSRIGRCGSASGPSTLPYALVVDRLGALIAGPEVDQALEVALGRVAVTQAAPPPVEAAGGSDRHGRAVGATRSFRTPPIDRGPVPGRSPRTPPPSAATIAPHATTGVPARQVSSSPQVRGREGGRNDETGRVGIGPTLMVRRDPAVAAILRRLTSPAPPRQQGSSDPGAASRPSSPAPPFGSPGAATATSVPAGPAPTTDAGRRREVAAASRRPPSRAPEPASTEPRPAAHRPGAVPPVGLAGLVAWWEDDPVPAGFAPSGPPTGMHDAARAAVLATPGARPPALIADPGWWRADEPPDVPAADPLALFRDALEQVLLDEALADGLEVSDGPA